MSPAFIHLLGLADAPPDRLPARADIAHLRDN
jgi:hypothetical protein